jgi:hypothetical protein
MGEQRSRTNFKTILYQLGWLIQRLPFTLCMVVILLGVAWVTQSYFQGLALTWINRLGFAPRDFWLFRWEHLVLSALVTQGGSIFWFALAMVAFTSGVAEWKSGSLRAFFTFWGVHIVTLMLESVLFLLPLHRLGFPAARAVFFSRDVGPSAGYMGSLGYIITFLPKPWRWTALVVILIVLITSLLVPPTPGQTLAIKLADDVAHLIAFPLGWLTATLIRGDFQRGYMSDKPVAQKLSIKPGSKLLLVHPPAGYIGVLGELPAGVMLLQEALGPVEAIQVFIANRFELEAQLPLLKRLMAPSGMLWVTYHKGTSKVKTDINRDRIVAYARTIGLQGVAMISIDEDWAALRLKRVEA